MTIKIRREGSRILVVVTDEMFSAGARLTAEEAAAAGERLVMLGSSNSADEIAPEVLEREQADVVD